MTLARVRLVLRSCDWMKTSTRLLAASAGTRKTRTMASGSMPSGRTGTGSGFTSALAPDQRADARVGEDLEQQGMGATAVDDVHLFHAAADRVERAAHLRDHAAADRAVLDQLLGLGSRERGQELAVFGFHALDVGHQH